MSVKRPVTPPVNTTGSIAAGLCVFDLLLEEF